MNSKIHSFFKLFFIFFATLGFVKSADSQTEKNGKIVAFHPSVGNSITLAEKKEFSLFSEYNDSLFESAQLVKYSIDTYAMLIKTTRGQSFEKPISITELDAIYAKIEKSKPAASINTATDDYVEENHSKEKQIKKERFETGYVFAQISLQVIFVVLEIIAHSY